MLFIDSEYGSRSLVHGGTVADAVLLQSSRVLHSTVFINLLKPTGYVMHQQFSIQQLYTLSTLYLCVLYLSQNKQRLVPLTA